MAIDPRDADNHYAECVPGLVSGMQQSHLDELEKRLQAEREASAALKKAAGDESMTLSELAGILGGVEDPQKVQERIDAKLAEIDREVAELMESKEKPDEPPTGRFPPPPRSLRKR